MRKNRTIVSEAVEDYQFYKQVSPVVETASRLLKKYGTTSNIPIRKLQNSNFEDAFLLAFCEIIEVERNKLI